MNNSRGVTAIDMLLGGDDYLDEPVVQQRPQKTAPVKARVIEESVSEDLYSTARAFLRVWLELHLKDKLSMDVINEAVNKAGVEELFSSYDPVYENDRPVSINEGKKLDPNDPRGSCEYRITTNVNFSTVSGETMYRTVYVNFRASVGGW